MNHKSIHFPASVNRVAQDRSDVCGVKRRVALILLLQTETAVQWQSVACLLHPPHPIRRSQYHLPCVTAAFCWVATQRVGVISYRRLGTTCRSAIVRGRESKRNFWFSTPEDGTERMSRNVGKKLSLLAAWWRRSAPFCPPHPAEPQITPLYIFVPHTVSNLSQNFCNWNIFLIFTDD